MTTTLSFDLGTSNPSDITISKDHFGLNLVGQYESVEGSEGWINYDNVHQNANATTIRWPGGVDAEHNHEELEEKDGKEGKYTPIIKYLNDGSVDPLQAAESYLDGAVDDKGDTSFAEVVDFARDAEVGITFVIPTNPLVDTNPPEGKESGWPLKGDPTDGNSDLGKAINDLKAYLRLVLDATKPKTVDGVDVEGVKIKAFEIGNEFWGTEWATPAAYGKGAAIVAEALHEVLNEPAYNNLAEPDPDVLIQVWGDAQDKGGNNPAEFLDYNLSIINAFSHPNWAGGDLDWIDGVAAHHYYKPGKVYGDKTDTEHTYATISDRIDFYGDLKDAWDLAAGKDMELHFTEWNVSQKTLEDGQSLNGNDNDKVAYGLKQIAPMLELFSSMIANGAEAAQFWSALYHAPALARDPREDVQEDPDQGYGLQVAGQFFATELTALEGYQYVELNGGGSNRETDYDVHLFTKTKDGDKEGVMYLSSLHADTQDFDLNLLSLMAIPGTVSVEVIGVDGSKCNATVKVAGGDLIDAPYYLQPKLILQRDTLTGHGITSLSATLTGIELDAYEVAKITFDMYETTTSLTNGVINHTASGTSDDFIKANNENNVINGGAGRDYIHGGTGDDTLIGGAGADNLNGGSGIDTASYADAGTKVNLDMRSRGTYGDAKNDTFVSVENVQGSGFGDYIYGTDAHNVLDGGNGDDRLRGHNGNDVLVGGKGADNLNGGSGTDTASYADAGAKVNLDLRSRGTSGDATNDTFVSIENVLGSEFGDYIYGNDARNTLIGGNGDDRLRGHNGNDTLVGGKGADNLHGGSGIDTASYADAGAKVNLDLRSRGTSGDAKNDTFVSVENVQGSGFGDYIYGNSTNNLLIGGAGDDRLRGDSGADVLMGGTGADDLRGGSGADTFVFNKGDGTDRIGDFYDNVDTIRLDAAFGTPAAVFGMATQQGDDVLFDFGSGDTLLIDDITIAQLQNDVEFV